MPTTPSEMPASPQKLRFVHLSDIHFSGRNPDIGFDPDQDIRNELLIDLRERHAELGPATALLVSGDLAFAGKRAEFEDAARWLDQVCDAAGCPREAVHVCPGNHDVDQDVIKGNIAIQDGYEAVRRERETAMQDGALMRRLMQPASRDLFYAPLRQYNEFAARYECTFYANRDTFAWDRDFTLNDGSTLRVRGLNSALMSGPGDQPGMLFLGTRAWTMPRHAGVEYLVMCHHPPNWLLDERDARAGFDDRARIQLFGHEHEQRIDPGRYRIKLFAGAVNPSRDERGWKPGYNVIEVHVAEGAERRMVVDVHAREWQGQPAQFRALEDRHHRPVFRVSIDLRALPADWSPPSGAASETTMTSEPHLEGVSATPPRGTQTPMRVVANRFFRLSLSRKNELVGHLNLSEESDVDLPDFERFKLALVRARDRGRFPEVEAFLVRWENE